MNTKKLTAFILTLVMIFSFASCGDSGSKNENTDVPVNDTETILTVTGYKDETTFSLSDLKKTGIKEYTFSGRNKENNNERQIRKYSGIELKTVLQNAGYSDDNDTILITCGDGYSREYALKDLNNLYYYKDKTTEKGELVPPILAVMDEGEDLGNDSKYDSKSGSPLRFVFGQTDYDSDYTKDFNMQGWASYVEKIEVKKGSNQ